MSTSETEPVFSIWASMARRYTPTPLFLLLNLVIITVAVAAYFTSSKPDPQNNPVYRFFRRPSLGDRVKSVNFSFNGSDSDPGEIFEDTQRIDRLDQTQSLDSDFYQTQPLVRAPSLLEHAKSWKFSFNPYKTESFERVQNTENYDNLEQTQFDNSDVAPRRTSLTLRERVKSLNLSLRLFEEQTQRDSDQYRGNSSQAPAIINKLGSGEMLVKTKQSAIGNKMGSGAMSEFGSEQGSGELLATGKRMSSGEMSEFGTEHGSGELQAIGKRMSSGEMSEFGTEHGSGELQAIGKRMSSGDMLLKMTKSASEKSKRGVKEGEDVEHRRPETTRARTSEDDSVNGKADDFITKFRQQLKLQRLDSMVRYREMIDRGSSQ